MVEPMGLFGSITRSLGGRRQQDAATDGGSVYTAAGPAAHAGLPRFLEVHKTIAISHAEISSLYFLVEELETLLEQEHERGRASNEARELADALQGLVARWNSSSPEGMYADLFELRWHDVA
jgi:hypothetical protein